MKPATTPAQPPSQLTAPAPARVAFVSILPAWGGVTGSRPSGHRLGPHLTHSCLITDSEPSGDMTDVVGPQSRTSSQPQRGRRSLAEQSGPEG